MDLLEKKTYYNNLYDYYRELLTDKQRHYFENYYFDDLSLAEIASQHQVSRNAVFDQLKKVYTSLAYYEEKLGLLAKAQAQNGVFEKYAKSENKEILQMIEELKNLE